MYFYIALIRIKYHEIIIKSSECTAAVVLTGCERVDQFIFIAEAQRRLLNYDIERMKTLKSRQRRIANANFGISRSNR